MRKSLRPKVWVPGSGVTDGGIIDGLDPHRVTRSLGCLEQTEDLLTGVSRRVPNAGPGFLFSRQIFHEREARKALTMPFASTHGISTVTSRVLDCRTRYTEMSLNETA